MCASACFCCFGSFLSEAACVFALLIIRILIMGYHPRSNSGYLYCVFVHKALMTLQEANNKTYAIFICFIF